MPGQVRVVSSAALEKRSLSKLRYSLASHNAPVAGEIRNPPASHQVDYQAVRIGGGFARPQAASTIEIWPARQVQADVQTAFRRDGFVRLFGRPRRRFGYASAVNIAAIARTIERS